MEIKSIHCHCHCQDLSKPLGKKVIWTLEFPTRLNKTCTYIIFKCAVNTDTRVTATLGDTHVHLGPCTNRPIVFPLQIGKRKWNNDSLSVSLFFN